ncbi:hypothetical protein O6P43_016915 [Quillaja saponaria]|uniref:Transmembrane protein n=1 Tax=Quillaja saponaria TaxID=32244 RepID=A0AAD7PND3_QUISA|nr:hypothetical protein O6P43_016915 [Quillaja saponaria]
MDNKKSVFPVVVLLPLFLFLLFSSNFSISATATPTPFANELSKVQQTGKRRMLSVDVRPPKNKPGGDR